MYSAPRVQQILQFPCLPSLILFSCLFHQIWYIPIVSCLVLAIIARYHRDWYCRVIIIVLIIINIQTSHTIEPLKHVPHISLQGSKLWMCHLTHLYLFSCLELLRSRKKMEMLCTKRNSTKKLFPCILRLFVSLDTILNGCLKLNLFNDVKAFCINVLQNYHQTMPLTMEIEQPVISCWISIRMLWLMSGKPWKLTPSLWRLANSFHPCHLFAKCIHFYKSFVFFMT